MCYVQYGSDVDNIDTNEASNRLILHLFSEWYVGAPSDV